MKLDHNSKAAKFITAPFHVIIADAIPLATAFYFTIKKLTNFSLEDNMDLLMKPAGVTFIIGVMLAIIAYSTLIKILIVIVGTMTGKIVTALDYTSFLQLYKKNNVEMEGCIKALSLPDLSKERFLNLHSYEKNVTLLAYSLNEHIKGVLHDPKLKQKELCISYYHRVVVGAAEEFHLVTHCDPSTFDIRTKRISSIDPLTKDFAAVKAVIAGSKVCLSSCSNGEYVKSGVKRRKTVKQFFSVPLEVCGEVEGVINIEFHHKERFASIRQMEEFYSDHLYGFKCLFEDQLLKRKFFSALADKIKT